MSRGPRVPEVLRPEDGIREHARVFPFTGDAPDARRSMGAAGRRIARERFGLDRMIGETEALYGDLLD